MDTQPSVKIASRIPIECVVFDYGNVISLPQSITEIEKMALACEVPPAKFDELYWRLRPQYDSGGIDGEVYWKRLISEAQLRPGAAFVDELISIDIKSWLNVNQGTLSWVTELHSQGVALALLSNMPPELARYIEGNCPWTSFFDHLLFSCDLQTTKPEPAIYEACIRRVNLPVEKILFLDDRRDNVEAAVKVGMNAVVFDDLRTVRPMVEAHFEFNP